MCASRQSAASPEVLVVAADAFRELCRNGIPIDWDEAILWFAPRKFFADAIAQLGKWRADLRVNQIPVRHDAVPFEFHAHPFCQFTDSRSFGAQRGIVDHLLNVAQTIRPLREVLAGKRTDSFPLRAASSCGAAAIGPAAGARFAGDIGERTRACIGPAAIPGRGASAILTTIAAFIAALGCLLCPPVSRLTFALSVRTAALSRILRRLLLPAPAALRSLLVFVRTVVLRALSLCTLAFSFAWLLSRLRFFAIPFAVWIRARWIAGSLWIAR